jgi:hypothetical protein
LLIGIFPDSTPDWKRASSGMVQGNLNLVNPAIGSHLNNPRAFLVQCGRRGKAIRLTAWATRGERKVPQ